MGRRRSKNSLEIEYKPLSVLDILKQMKNLSSLMMDLSYFAFLNQNIELAQKVHELEEQVDKLYYHLVMSGTLAVRDREDAEAITGIIQIGNALDIISNAAADIAKLAIDHLISSEIVKVAFSMTEELVAALTIWNDSKLNGRPLKYLEDNDIFVDVIAVKDDKDEWIIDPPEKLKLRSGYTIIVRGTKEQIQHLYRLNGQELPYEYTKKELENLKSSTGEYVLVDRIIEMKDKVELMLDLAYSAVMLNDKKIANQVLNLENYFDWLESDYEFLVLALINDTSVDKSTIVALIRLGVATESMADSAARIAEIVVRGLTPHPILKRVLYEGEEFLRVYEVKENSPLIGMTVGDLESKFGVQVIAVERGGNYYFDTDEEFHLEKGDIVIIRGFEEAKDDLDKVLQIEDEE